MALQLHKNYVPSDFEQPTWTQSLMQIVGFIIVSFRRRKKMQTQQKVSTLTKAQNDILNMVK